MKFAPRNGRRAHSALRVAATLLAFGVLPFLLHAAAPNWWSQRRVLIPDAPPDDYAPANQGQVKKLAAAAIAEMDARLMGGAGEPLHDLLNSWSTPAPATNDFAPVNLGQLKKIAQPFYERLIALGVTDTFPWSRSLDSPDDFAVANIGQVKNLFSFNIPSPNIVDDPHGDRLAAGEYSANLAVHDYAVWIWGDHFTSGSDFDRNLPRRLNDPSGIKAVAAGEHHLVALGNDGTVSTWGDNLAGQLGDGTSLSRSAPAPIPNLSNVVSVKAGGGHTLALQADGNVLAWGANYYGQLGTGDTNSSSTPLLIPGLSNVTRIAAGNSRSVALTTDGTVWIWGYEHYSGGDIFSPSPRLVPDLTGVVEVAAGYEHNIVVKADGTVWTWGSNYSNQLGTGAPRGIYQDVAVQVPGLLDIRKVASSYDHSLALASDGTVWAWGNNFSGQLGDGTNAERQTPVRVAGLTDVIAVASAYSYSLAMKADGTVWAWGDFAPGIMPGLNPRVPQQIGLGLFDRNSNGMDDRWELQFFGNLDQAPDADFDGDRVSNRAEYLCGTNPTDYFNGASPVVEIASGNNQIGDAGTFLSRPLKVTVRDASGQTLVNAPVTFSVSNGSGGLSLTTSNATQPNVNVRTDSDGIASTYLALLNEPGTSIRTTATAGRLVASAKTSFRSTARLATAPVSTSSASPSATPGPTPSPTATPRPPYRYVILDLGKDVYPYRINNYGQILMEGFDSNGNWGPFRWNGANYERLTYAGSDSQISVRDMNDLGAVVGELTSSARWKVGGDNELTAGLYWAPDQSVAAKISGHGAFKAFEPTRSGTFRMAGLAAINNSNELFGSECTGTVRGFPSWTLIVLNSQVWPIPSTPLSTMTAINVSPDSDTSIWQGTSDKISRANGKGHYIGTKFTPATGQLKFMQGSETGMIDGTSVGFRPVDIDEYDVVIGYDASGSMIIRAPQPAPSPGPGEPSAPVPSGFSYFSIANTAPIAVNDHTRPATVAAPTDGPQPTPIPAAQILSWVGNALAMWELQPDGQTWHPFGLEEMIPSMDNWLYLDPSATNDSGAIVGRGWFTDPSIPNDPGSYHGFMLVPTRVIVSLPKDQSTFAFCDDVKLSAQVDGAFASQVERMQYRTSDSIIAEAKTNPGWAATWHSPSPATYSVKARAIFSSNISSTESEDISVTVLPISRKAVDLILAQEITSRPYCEQRYMHPDWPGQKSGVTIGIGYDLGQTPASRIRSDWAPYVDDDTLGRLVEASGVLGLEARDKRNSMRDITIPYEVAEQVYYRRTLPYWISQTSRIYPEVGGLHPNIAGALVSMVFNRGPSLSDAGRNPGAASEMRRIAQELRNGNVTALPQLLRDMERLWSTNSAEHRALRSRRDAEADMIARALQDPANTCN